MAAKKCLICNCSFAGRKDAKTCSSRCRKRLQLVKLSFSAVPVRRRLAKTLPVLLLGLLGIGLPLLGSARATAAPSTNLNFQARLLSSSGSIVADGNYNIEFKLYDVSSGGTALWTEARLNNNTQGVRVVNGYISVNLGSVTAFPSTIKWNEEHWLTMNIGSTNGSCTPFSNCSPDGEMSPRIKLTAQPFAFQSEKLATTSGSNRSVLEFTAPTANRNITIPDASGVVCFQSAAACGFATGSGSAFLQGGNTFGATATLGTNDANGINIRTNTNTVLSLSSTGATLFKNFTDSATAFQIQNAAGGSNLFVADTINTRIGIGTSAPNTTLDINGAVSIRGMSAPAVSPGGQGRLYFDSTSNTFKASENGGAYADIVETISLPVTYYVAPSGLSNCAYDGDGGQACTPSDSNNGLSKAAPFATISKARDAIKNKIIGSVVTIQLADTTGGTCYQPDRVEFQNVVAGGPPNSTLSVAITGEVDTYPQGYIYIKGNTATPNNVSIVGATTCAGTVSNKGVGISAIGTVMRLHGVNLKYFSGTNLGAFTCYRSTCFFETSNSTSDHDNIEGSAFSGFFSSSLKMAGTFNFTNTGAAEANQGSTLEFRTPLGYATANITRSSGTNGFGFFVNELSHMLQGGLTATFTGAGTYNAFGAWTRSSINWNSDASSATTINGANITMLNARQGSHIDEACGAVQQTCTFTSMLRRAFADISSFISYGGTTRGTSTDTATSGSIVADNFGAGAPLNINGTGAAVFKNALNSGSALQIQNASGSAILKASSGSQTIRVSNFVVSASEDGFPSTPVLDNFNRANEGPPPSTNWSQGPINFTAANGLKVISNQVSRNTTGSYRQDNYWNTATYGPDSEVYATVATMGASDELQLGLRLQQIGSGTSDGYVLDYNTADNSWTLNTMTNTSTTPLGQATQVISGGDSIGFQAIGTTLNAWYKPSGGVWTLLISRTSSTYSSAGYISLGIAGSDVSRLDDFGGGTIGTNPLTGQFSVNSSGKLLSRNLTNSTNAFQIQNAAGNALFTVDTANTEINIAADVTAKAVATATTGTTTGTGTNTTTLTLTADPFSVNDVILIDNAGQDYYTRITADPGTNSYTVSPAVTFETGRTVTKYTIQNIGATATDYSTLVDRFFQGYFLGGVVVGTGTTTLSDGQLSSTGVLNFNATDYNFKRTADSATAFQIQNAAGASLLTANTTDGRVNIGSSTTNSTANLFVLDSYDQASDPTGVAGGMYYNSNLGKFRCYQAAAWIDCAGSGGGGSTPTLQDAYNNSSSPATITTTSASKDIIIKSGSGFNSASVFQIQNASSANILNIDTSTSSNAITNGDIEGGNTTGWAAKGSSTLSKVTTQQWQGNSSLQVAATTTANDGAKYDYTFTASTQYTLSLYAKVSSGSITDFVVGRQDVSGTDINCLTGQTVTTSWTRFSCTFTTGGTITSSNIYAQKSGTAAETFFIDGVQLETGATSTAFNAGGALQLSGLVNSPVAFKNKSNSTTAFQIQNASGAGLFNVNSTSSIITLGSAGSTPVLLVLGNKNTAGDPTCIDGAIYNHSYESKLKGCQAGSWGYLINSAQEAVRVYRTTSLSISNITNTDVSFDNELYDTGNFHDNTTNNHLLIVNSTDRYHIFATVRFASNSTGYRKVSIVANNGISDTVLAQQVVNAVNGAETVINLSTVSRVYSNETLRLEIYQNSGGALNIEPDSESSPVFGYQRINW